MSGEESISLARKWRPRRFADLVGHEYAARALQNAVSQNRLHHAFLFTGTRGVGKTTMARLLALLFNCKNQTEKEPCLECESCTAIIAGRFPDVIEVDAASHTKVEETRELLEGAVYVPAIGKFKVFIIDEVHMLSKNSFNAMLKTLEEPPPHVKFILATTNPEKIPATILSRCLCFSLSPLPKHLIVGRLQDILSAEAVKFEEAAVSEIARLARGSLRDALSIADQAIAHCDSLLRAEDVRRLVGDIDLSALADILRALSKADTPAVAAVAARLVAENTGFDTALARLAALIYKAALFAAVPDAETDNPEEAVVAKEAAGWFSPEELQALYEIALRGRRQLPYAPDEQTGFEMTLLRMTLFSPQSAAESSASAAPAAVAPAKPPAAIPEAPPPKSAAESSAAAPATAPVAKPPAAIPEAPKSAAESSAAAAPAAVPVAKPPAAIPEAPPPTSKAEKSPAAAKDWPSVTAQLNETALALVRNCTLRSFDDKGVILVLDESRINGSEYLLGHLKSELARICGKSFKLELLEGKDNAAQEARQKAAEAAAMKVPFVRDFLAAMPESRLLVDDSSKPDGA